MERWTGGNGESVNLRTETLFPTDGGLRAGRQTPKLASGKTVFTEPRDSGPANPGEEYGNHEWNSVENDVQSKQSAASDLIAQIEERDQELKAQGFSRRYRRTRRGLRYVGGIVCASLVGFLVWQYVFAPAPGPAFTQAELEASVDLSVFLTVEGIEEHFSETGELPESLESIGLDDPLIRYTLDGDSYHLIASSAGHQVSYRRGDDLGPLRPAFGVLHGRSES